MIVKVCGFTRAQEAALAAEAGVDIIGLTFYKRSPRCISAAKAVEIATAIRGSQARLSGLFVDAPAEEPLHFVSELGLSYVQLAGHESRDYARKLRALLPPAVEIYGSLRLPPGAAISFLGNRPGGALPDPEDILPLIGNSPSFLIDAAARGMLGGTGKSVDPDLIRPYLGRYQVLLAGGLRPEGLEKILDTCPGLWGLDVASGVEDAPGRKNIDKIKHFVGIGKSR